MISSLPLVLPGMRIGLLGGSFDPAHDGHAHITQNALIRFGLDRVWWLVSPGNPLKKNGPAPLTDRIRGAKQLMRHPKVDITDIEVRLGTRMTADTIAALQRICPRVHFVWLMGSDNLVQFDHWDRWQEIAERVPLGVLARPGSRLAARRSRTAQILRHWRLPEERARELPLTKPPAWVLLNLPMSHMSSTLIRQERQDGTETT